MVSEIPEGEDVYKRQVITFSRGWMAVHNPASDRPVTDALTTMEFSIAMLACRDVYKRQHQSSCLVNGDSNELKLRVILDKFSVEVFINDGEQVMSAVILTKQEAKGISFFADGAVKLDIVDVYKRQDWSKCHIGNSHAPIFT